MKALIFCLCLWMGATAAVAEGRTALVIGNADYLSAPTLANPVNDARAIAAALGRLGFEVFLGTDLDTEAMRRLIRDFSNAAETSDLALFFYAGHGIQVAGRNYLIPTDAVLERESDLDFAAVDLQIVLRQLELAGGHSIILLDACRDNPFETRLSRAMGAARSSAALGRGLAQVETLGGALIGFATDPGEVAFDGSGANSPFTAALLSHIETPGLEVNALMTRVRADVVAATGQQQRPWSTSSLLSEVYLAAAEEAGAASATDPLLADVDLWKSADQDGTRDALMNYLARFPDGLFADLARDRLAETDPNGPPEERVATAQPVLPQPRAGAAAGAGVDAAPAEQDGACDFCPDLVALAGGTFRMGSASDLATPAEGPVTTVTLAPFRMSVGEVTVGDYRRFLAASGYQPAEGCYVWTPSGKMRFRKDAGWAFPGFDVSDEMPAACVSWHDASAYAAWLGEVSGLRVRLPSEAEQEYAIRAGSAGEYPFGDGAEGACAAVNAADASSRFAWRNDACTDGFPDLAPARQLAPNGLGLVATTGNLWEWAADCWHPTHAGARPDGAARGGESCEGRVLRGASWDDPPKNLRSAYRVGIPATRRQANVGFRIVVGP